MRRLPHRPSRNLPPPMGTDARHRLANSNEARMMGAHRRPRPALAAIAFPESRNHRTARTIDPSSGNRAEFGNRKLQRGESVPVGSTAKTRRSRRITPWRSSRLCGECVCLSHCQNRRKRATPLGEPSRGGDRPGCAECPASSSLESNVCWIASWAPLPDLLPAKDSGW